MFRIGEFSKLMQVSVRMLRYYDEVGLLNPAQSDPWTGYRMYSVEQIPVLNRILYLRDCGFTVAEMEGLVLGNDDRMMEALKNKEKEIALAIKAEEQKLHRIDHAKQDLLQGTADLHFNVDLLSPAGFHQNIHNNFFFLFQICLKVFPVFLICICIQNNHTIIKL